MRLSSSCLLHMHCRYCLTRHSSNWPRSFWWTEYLGADAWQVKAFLSSWLKLYKSIRGTFYRCLLVVVYSLCSIVDGIPLPMGESLHERGRAANVIVKVSIDCPPHDASFDVLPHVHLNLRCITVSTTPECCYALSTCRYRGILAYASSGLFFPGFKIAGTRAGS